MNGRLTSSSQLISAFGTKTPGYPMQTFNTHDHSVNLLSLSIKSHILANEASLAWVRISYPSCNTT